jgi:hypothetical protein
MIRHRSHAIVILTVLGLVAPVVSGQGRDLSGLLAPCVNEQTLAIAQIDVGGVNVDAILDWVVETAPRSMDSQQVKEVTKRWRPLWEQRVARFQAAGGQTLYIAWGLDDPLLAVPVTNRLKEPAMTDWLKETWQAFCSGRTTSVRKDGLLITGSRGMMDRWQSRARAELAQATANAGGAAIEVFVIPSMDSRRVLEAMLPVVIDQGMEAKGHPITAGLQWATIRIDLPPAPALRVAVASGDAASASALRGVLGTSLNLVGRIAALKQASTDLAEALGTLMPEVRGQGLQLALDKRQCNRLGSGFVTPGVFALRASILHQLCQTTLSGMGKAMLIYANDHEDKWPPRLETLVEKAEYSRSGLICPAMRHRPQYESYVYRGVDTGGVSVDPELIIVHDRAGNHEGGRHVLFADSHIDWVTETRFTELVARDNELRREQGFAEKPAQ